MIPVWEELIMIQNMIKCKYQLETPNIRMVQQQKLVIKILFNNKVNIQKTINNFKILTIKAQLEKKVNFWFKEQLVKEAAAKLN